MISFVVPVHNEHPRLGHTLSLIHGLPLPGKAIATVLLLLFAPLGPTLAAEPPNEPKSLPELQTAIEAVLKETRTPGAAIAIVSRDKVEWLAGLGKADVAAGKPVTADTLFRLGSVSKSFVALAALQLQEEGKLKLTNTVKQWVPDVAFTNPWEADDPVRLVHLLEHTSGFDDMYFREYALNDPAITLKNALAYGAASRTSRWPPGTRMAYCNSGPAVIAAVVEKVSGERFEDYVQTHLFNPLHMEGASYFYTPAVEQRLAKLYRQDGVTPYPYWHIALRPTAAVSASVKDMANYVRFFLQRGSLDGTQLLQPSSIERMEIGETMPSAKLGAFANYGLFNYPTPEGPFVFHGHNGAVMGGMSQIGYLTDHDRGYVLMINSGCFRATYQIGTLLRNYVTRDLTPPPLPALATIPIALAPHYNGYYQMIDPDEQWLYGFARLINVKMLNFTTNGISTSTYGLLPKQWVPISERLFRQDGESVASLALLPDDQGNTLIQYGFGTFKKVSALRIWAQLAGISLVSLLVFSSFLFVPVWLRRKWRRKPLNTGPLSLRILPLLGAISLVAFDLLIASGMRGILTSTFVDDISFGTRTLLTVGILLSSIALPLAAASGLYVAYRERATPMNRVAYWHSVLVTLALAASAIYMGYWGLIGLRLWA